MISALRYDKDVVEKFDLSSLEESLKEKLVWVDVTNHTKEELSILQEKFSLDPLSIEDVTHKDQRPKVEDYDTYLFTVSHLLNIVENEVKTTELFLFLGNRWLISVHDNESRVTETVKKMLKPGVSRIVSESAALYHILIDLTVDQYFPVMDVLDDRIEELDEEVAREPSEEILREVARLRRQLLLVRKSLWPTREVLTSIMKGIYHVVSDQNLQYFRDVQDHLVQLTDLLDTDMRLTDNLRDAYYASAMTSLNQVMKTFTAVATIILPLTLIASIYGMNFVNMPELKLEYGYFYVIIIMIITILVVVTYFWRKRWF